MSREKEAQAKPLSFSTTMRNPYRIVDYLKCLVPFENQILSHEIIMKIIHNVIKYKVYKPNYAKTVPEFKNILLDEERFFSDDQVKKIIENSGQNHKEAGFNYGWESRFDTIFKLPMEFGYIYYAKDEILRVSDTGHMLIDALNENPVNEEKIQNVFLNSLIKYQTNNPFRKNSNKNVPLILLLQVMDLLKKGPIESNAGISIQELSLFICWPDNNAPALYNKIKKIRQDKKFSYSDEYMYDICLGLLNANDTQKNRFKMSQICGEAIDEYIRKMRSTGIISLRGNGRFLDFNMLEIEKINYILSKYTEYKSYTNKFEYYEYMGTIDSNVISISISNQDILDVRKAALLKFAEYYDNQFILEELKRTCVKKNESKDELFRYIPAPTRLEFLTAIALVQQFEGLDVNPNYVCDDEGVPTCTAGGGIADIICNDIDYDSLVEVTLMRGRSDQINNEIIPIKRHLEEAVRINKDTFSVFVAPQIHADVVEYIDFNNYQNSKRNEKLNIVAFGIEDFILRIQSDSKISQLLSS